VRLPAPSGLRRLPSSLFLKGLKFSEIFSEVEDHLNRAPNVRVLVEAVDVKPELVAVANDLLATLLEGNLHVLSISGADVGP
jgi:hypothetical protein